MLVLFVKFGLNQISNKKSFLRNSVFSNKTVSYMTINDSLNIFCLKKCHFHLYYFNIFRNLNENCFMNVFARKDLDPGVSKSLSFFVLCIIRLVFLTGLNKAKKN